jgi:HTH-type transcriptional regulator / antitoxin HigA
VDEHRTPGQLITALLNERGWDQNVLGIVLGLSQPNVSRIISGRKKIDPQLAIALSEVFSVDAAEFLRLQQAYDLGVARLTSIPDEGRSSRAAIFGTLPVAEMAKRGWIDPDSTKDGALVEKELARFFGVSSAADVVSVLEPHAAKKTDAESPATATQIAWIRRVRQIASGMVVQGKYSPDNLRGALPKLSDLLLSAEEARNAPRFLAEAGVRFVIVQSLKSSKIDGVTLWLDDRSPVIGMSLRFDRIDNFWFVLRHEIEHVLHGHGRAAPLVDSDLELAGDGSNAHVPDEERIANTAASSFCVSQQALENFIARKAPLFAERDLLGFARIQQIHPGLVAGQIRRRVDRYDLFTKHLVKIKSIVAPCAIADGWGDVAPVV